MKRAYKERFYPTDEQAELLAKSFWCARFVYNNTLRYRTDSYYKNGEKVSHSDAEKRHIQIKKEFPWLTEISSVILQQSLRDQQQAYLNFWAGRAK
jgi:putative transposase